MGASGNKTAAAQSGRQREKSERQIWESFRSPARYEKPADNRWEQMSPKSRCPPMTERRGLSLCYTSDYSLYPWVISNLRNMLSKQGDIKCGGPTNITGFLLEEEADGNRNPPTLPFSHPGRKGIIIKFIWHYRHPPFVLLWLSFKYKMEYSIPPFILYLDVVWSTCQIFCVTADEANNDGEAPCQPWQHTVLYKEMTLFST